MPHLGKSWQILPFSHLRDPSHCTSPNLCYQQS